MADLPKPRTRRSTEEVRELILQSARQVFSERGYAATSTREIARRAGTTEALIFRHYVSKEQLFREAVFAPFEQFWTAFIAIRSRSGDAAPGSLEEARASIEGLWGLISQNRGLIHALITPQGDAEELVENARSNESLMRYLADAAAYVEQSGWASREVEPRLAVRFSFILEIAMVLFEDWLFPENKDQAARAHNLDQLARFIMGGFGSAHGKPEEDG